MSLVFVGSLAKGAMKRSGYGTAEVPLQAPEDARPQEFLKML